MKKTLVENFEIFDFFDHLEKYSRKFSDFSFKILKEFDRSAYDHFLKDLKGKIGKFSRIFFEMIKKIKIFNFFNYFFQKFPFLFFLWENTNRSGVGALFGVASRVASIFYENLQMEERTSRSCSCN